jgi:predicted permease
MAVKELAFACRMLWRSPLFTVTAGITIVLGVGCSTAVFSVANTVLIRPLPYADADRLVTAWVDYRKPNVRDIPFSNARFLEVQPLASAVFEDLAGVFTFRVISSREDGRPERIFQAVATTNLFRMLGTRVVLGRDFIAADGQPVSLKPGAGVLAPSAAILSYDYWQRRYGANPAIIGHELAGSGQRGPLIVGVLAPGFQLFFPPPAGIEARPDVWLADNLGADPRILGLRVIGKLRRGVRLKQAEDRVDAIAQQIRVASVFDASSDLHIRLEPMQGYNAAESRPAILALSGASLILLLISFLNVADLMMVRTSARRRELAIRAALGATPGRIIRLLSSEAALLSALGTAGGLGLAWALIRVFRTMVPVSLPRADSIQLDWPAAGFAAAGGLAAAALVGFGTSVRGAKAPLMGAMRGSYGTSVWARPGYAKDLLVVVQVALSLVLLVTSGLLARSLYALEQVDPGYDPHGILTFLAVRDWDANAPAANRLAFLNTLQRRLRSLPGVEGVTATPFLPLTGGFGGAIDWSTDQSPAGPPGARAATLQSVLPGYFETLRTKLIAGRTFQDPDNFPESRVAIVDAALAAKAFPNQSAVGKRIRLDFLRQPWVEIVGVVAHQRLSALASPGREEIFVTDGMIGFGVGRYWAVRVPGNPAAAAPAVVASLAELDPQILILELQPMDAIVSRAGSSSRFALLLIGFFAVVATTLAGVGLYGVHATLVRQRSWEIGVRVALGADPTTIVRLVIAQGLRITAAGVAAGLLVAFGVTQVVSTMLVGVRPTDPVTFAAAAAIFLVIAGLTCWGPARQAARLDPSSTLRE